MNLHKAKAFFKVMNMYINRIKSYIIVCLFCLAVYQTAELWFEDFSGHNFFYSLLANPENSNNQKEIEYTLESILINRGNNKFITKVNGIYESEYKPVFDEAIKQTLKHGSFSGEQTADWNEILSGKCVVYNYNYTLKGSELSSMFKVPKTATSKTAAFDKIILKPNTSVPESMSVLFVDSNTEKTYTFKIENNHIILQTYNQIDSFKSDNDKLYYISSVQNGFNLFQTNQFIPRWTGSSIEYEALSMYNPFENDGSVLLTSLEKDIDIFFDNPAVKWKSTINDVYTYSDENTVVKYYTTGVLEYASYKSGINNPNPNFHNSYMTAIAFIKNDVNIANEYYLREYEINDNRITFYFDYKINDFKITLSDSYAAKLDMKSIMEVTVSNGEVSKYRRFVYNFKSNPEKPAFAEIDFLEAIDNVFSINSNQNTADIVNNIDLSYSVEENNNTFELYWKINTPGISYLFPAKKSE